MTRVYGRDKICERTDNSRSLRDDKQKKQPQVHEDREALVKEDRPTGPYIEALVNPS
jgi:hypothetical protein